MLSGDDLRYVRKSYLTLEEACDGRAETAADVRRLIEAGKLPQPSYVLEDGTELVPPDYFELLDAAGGVDRLRGHFEDRFLAAAVAESARADPVDEEWAGYLSGGYGVCLWNVTPEDIVRKATLMAEIQELIDEPRPDEDEWRERLRAKVDELDGLERPFTAHDRERFGGPVSRDRLITDVRERYLDRAAGAAQ